jgi:transposase
MTIIGFDVARDEIVGVRIDRSTAIKERCVIGNNSREITALIHRLQNTKQRLLAACEATAEYHLVLAKICVEAGVTFRLLNPILTKQFTRSTIRKRKTDLTDAHIIAKLALQGEGTVIQSSYFSPVKAIARTSLKLGRVRQTVYLIAERYRHHVPDEIELRQQLDKCLVILEESIALFRHKTALAIDPATARLLQSVPGIGPTIVGSLIAEIGEIERFRTAKALVAYAGLDPKVKQSGASLNHNTSLTKRGSAPLRRNLFIAATIAQRCDRELKDYYDKKRQEGKRYKEATIAVARKLIHRIYAVWKRQKPYRKPTVAGA